MPTRIYALAKELKLDTKELVDLCEKAGVPGKGSALATLTDEETEKVLGFVSKKESKPAAGGGGGPAPVPPPMSKPQGHGDSGKMPVIVARKPPKTASEPEEPIVEETPETSDVEGTTTPAVEEIAAEETAAPEAAEARPEEGTVPTEIPAEDQLARPTPIRRDEYIGPGMGAGKMPVVGGGGSKPGQKKGAPPAAGGRPQRPTVKLAPLPPSAEKPAPQKKKKAEPAPQKPDMKLPADAIRASKAGSKPLAAHLRRHERVAEAEKLKRQSDAPAEDSDRRRGSKKRGRGKEDDKQLLGGREQRQLRRRARGDDSDRRPPRRMARRNKKSGVNTAAPRKDRITLELPCSVRELSEAAGVPAAEILRILMQEGLMTTITAELDPELAELVAADLGVDIEFRQPVSLEDELLTEILNREDSPESLSERPPVITFLGHVDHGKTSLLDRIIGSDVVSGESGGITQHIRAYQIDHNGRPISFVDTPGHEAFTEMRARGANVTDIAVLVVAADDGVMPQTEEAISHARAAEVPIVVALNKTDLPGVDINRAMQQLSANDLLPSEWGGDVEVVKTSAITGDGVDDLLETVLTVAELHEYTANPDRDAFGTSLESHQETGRGVVSKVIVQNGTLRVGDTLVCGEAFGKVRAMFNPLRVDEKVEEAGPSCPVNLVGLDTAPEAGEHFFVLNDISQAREIAESRAHESRHANLSGGPQHVTLETLFERLEGVDEVQTLNLILRADVRGSIEAIEKEMTKLEHPEVKIKFLQAAVGGVSEADVTLADASDAIILGFNVVPDEGARQLADKRGVQIRRYDVIYKITDDLRAAIEGMLRPEEREVDLGRALVQQTFKISRVGTVAGCRVITGSIDRHGRARIIRDNTIIGDYPIDTLRREKDDAKEVREGLECGIKLSGFNDIKEGDLLEVYRVEEVGRKFEDTAVAT